VADEYKKLLKELGIPFSLDKSLSSDSVTIRIEFAKRIFLDGSEITPLSPKLLSSACKSIYMLFQLVDVMKAKG
jgi:hypothetical protein